MFQFWSGVWKPIFGSSSNATEAVRSNTKSANLMASAESLSPAAKPWALRSSSSSQSSRSGKRKAEQVHDARDREESPSKRIPRESSKSTVAGRKRVIPEANGSSSRTRAWSNVAGCNSNNRATAITPQSNQHFSRVSKVGTWYFSKANLTPEPDGNAKKNLLNSIFCDRAFTVVAPKAAYKLGSSRPIQADLEFVFDDKYHTLASFKSHDHAGGGGFGSFARRKIEFEWIYIVLRGGGFENISLQHELDKIANFRELDTRKAVVRLGHLQSPACHVWNDLNCSQFEMIEEKGHVGCGFIPEDLLEELIGECKSKKIAQSSLGIQVRIVGPKIGLFKGMLFRKKNITKIQLPTSMLKVSPTTSSENVVGFNNQNWVYMLATQQGVFPSENHRSLGQRLEALKRNKPLPYCDTIKKNNRGKKILSDMIIRLWLGLGVPENTVDHYIDEIKRTDLPKHAWPVGVIDPTGFLPPGHIFVTGLPIRQEGRQKRLQSVFITRSPCVNPDDVQILPIVTKKPPEMPSSTWKWLNQLHFGAVIFPLCQSSSEVSLPETIASGDLDGDLYFTCWDDTILSCLLRADGGVRWGGVQLFDVTVKSEDDVEVAWKEIEGIVEIISDDENDESWVRNSAAKNGGYLIKDEIEKLSAACQADMDSIIEISSDEEDEHVICLSDEFEDGDSWEKDRRIQILAHREEKLGSYEVRVRWHCGKKSWEPLSVMKYKFPTQVMDYARKNNLTSDIEFYLTDSDEDDHLSVWNSDTLPGENDWFRKAQKLMLHLPLMNDIGRLVGCLFQLNKVAAENSTEGIHDEDAIAFGAAYKKSLELEKHFEKCGGRVYLPRHLHEQVKPKQLHKFLTCSK